MSGYSTDIDNRTLKNANYRKVIHTDDKQQIALMSLSVGEDIPFEIHDGTQFFHIRSGSGVAILIVNDNKKIIKIYNGICLFVPSGMKHMIKNTSKKYPLKLFTIYSPPQHKHGKINKRQPANAD